MVQIKNFELHETIENLIRLIFSEPEDDYYTAPIHRVSIKTFDGFEPLIGEDERDFILVGDTPGDQPVWPLDVSFSTQMLDDERGLQFNRYKTLKPKEWRGIIHQFYPKMIDATIMMIFPNKKSSSIRIPFALVNNKVVHVKRTITGYRVDGHGGGMDVSWFGGGISEDDKEDLEWQSRTISVVAGLMLRRRYTWSVLIGKDNGPRVRFVTDPTGMREIFRLRDIPEGRLRRAALLNWVKEHWRKKRDVTANDRIFIQKYLRGVWSYKWNGFTCQIEPSEYDLEKVIKD
jgi:hypothetical protein